MLAVVLMGLHGSARLRADTGPIYEAASLLLDTVRSGDYEAVSQQLLGAPELGNTPEPDSAEGMLWDAWRESLTYTLADACTAEEAEVLMDAEIRCLDIPAVMDAIEAAMPKLLVQKAKAFGSEEAIYDSEHRYRDEFVNSVLHDAAADALAKHHPEAVHTLTLRLSRADGRWQVVPTQELQQLLCAWIDG